LQRAELEEGRGQGPPEDYEMDIWSHIEELLVRLRRVAIALVAASIIIPLTPVSLNPYTPLIAVFPRMFIDGILPDRITVMGMDVEVVVIQSSPFAGISLILKTALIIGLLAVSPLIAWEFYSFIKPALYPEERRLFVTLGVLALLLFGVGLAAAYVFILPMTYRISFLASATIIGDRIAAFADVSSLFTSAIMIMIAVGLMFEAPVVAYALARAGMISEDLAVGFKGRMLFAASLVIAAIITPDPSGVTMIALAVPFYLAVRLAITLGARHRRGRQAVGFPG